MSAPSDRRLAPPSGWPPPPQYRAQAEQICVRHFEMHPEQVERYGEHGMAWCVHDLQHILAWAESDAAGHVDLEKEVRWLAGVLAARHFPIETLADDLEIAADVVPEFGARLHEVAAVVRSMAG